MTDSSDNSRGPVFEPASLLPGAFLNSRKRYTIWPKTTEKVLLWTPHGPGYFDAPTRATRLPGECALDRVASCARPPNGWLAPAA